MSAPGDYSRSNNLAKRMSIIDMVEASGIPLETGILTRLSDSPSLSASSPRMIDNKTISNDMNNSRHKELKKTSYSSDYFTPLPKPACAVCDQIITSIISSNKILDNGICLNCTPCTVCKRRAVHNHNYMPVHPKQTCWGCQKCTQCGKMTHENQGKGPSFGTVCFFCAKCIKCGKPPTTKDESRPWPYQKCNECASCLRCKISSKAASLPILFENGTLCYSCACYSKGFH